MRSRPALGAAVPAAIVCAEVAGFLTVIVPLPAGWMWVGSRVYDATGSIVLDLLTVLTGFLVSIILLMNWLVRLDAAWVAARRRAGHDEREGPLTRVVVATMTLVMIVFWVWFHVLNNAFIIQFMPMH